MKDPYELRAIRGVMYVVRAVLDGDMRQAAACHRYALVDIAFLPLGEAHRLMFDWMHCLDRSLQRADGTRKHSPLVMSVSPKFWTHASGGAAARRIRELYSVPPADADLWRCGNNDTLQTDAP